MAGEIAGKGGEGGLSNGAKTGLLHLEGALPEGDSKALGPELLERRRKAGAGDGVQGVGGDVCIGSTKGKNLLNALAESSTVDSATNV